MIIITLKKWTKLRIYTSYAKYKFTSYPVEK
jgi:hypothetical protein